MPEVKKPQNIDDNQNLDIEIPDELNLEDISLNLSDDVDLSDISNIPDGGNIQDIEIDTDNGIEDLESDDNTPTDTYNAQKDEDIGNLDLSMDLDDNLTNDDNISIENQKSNDDLSLDNTDSLNTDDLNLDDLQLEDISIEDNDLEGLDNLNEASSMDNKEDMTQNMDSDLNLDDQINMDDDIKLDGLDEDINLDDISENQETIKLEDNLDDVELNLKSDLGLKDQLSLSEDEEMNNENSNFDIDLSDDDFGSSEEEYGVDLKQDPQTIDSAAMEESMNAGNILEDESYFEQLEEDTEIEKINLPEKKPLSINDEQEDFLHEDLNSIEEPANENIEFKDDISLDNIDDIENLDDSNLKLDDVADTLKDLKLDEDVSLDLSEENNIQQSVGEIANDTIKDNYIDFDNKISDLSDDDLKIEEDDTFNQNIIESQSNKAEKNISNDSSLDLEDELSFDLDLDSGDFKDIKVEETDTGKKPEQKITSDDTLDLNLDEDIPMELDKSSVDELSDISTDDISLDLVEEPAQINVSKSADEMELSLDSDMSSEDLTIDEDNLNINDEEFINMSDTEKVDDKLDLESINKTPSTLKSEIVGDSMKSTKEDSFNLNEESIKLEEADLSDIEDKIFPDEETMPELDEDIASVKISGNEEYSNSISPLADAGTVLDDNIELELDESADDSKIDIDMSEIDLENIPSETISTEKEEEEETIGLSSEELDNIIKDTDLNEEGPVAKADEFDEMTETIDLSNFDADLQEVHGDEIELQEVNTEERVSSDEVYGNLKNEMIKQKQSETMTSDPDSLKKNVKEVLRYLDQLLEALPEEKIKEFAESKTFDLYKNLFDELKIEH